jgi:hypothetical protein
MIGPIKEAQLQLDWHNFPFAKVGWVAKRSKVSNATAIDRYPHKRRHKSFRFNQTIHCVLMYGYAENKELARRFGVAETTLWSARKWVAAAGLTIPPMPLDAANSTPTPEPVAERQDTPVVVEPVEDVGVKFDGDKPRHDLIAPEMLEGVAAVLAHGAGKYGERNWEKGLGWSRPFAACMRHLWAWWRGEDLDQESGLPHLDHAACNIMFLCAFAKRGTGTDDRG